MALLDEHTHYALACLEAVNEGGGEVAGGHLDRYRPYGQVNQNNLVSSRIGFGLGPPPMSQYLEQVGWAVRARKANYVITSAGRAVLRASERSRSSGSSPDSVLEVVLKPDDPLVYARLIRRVAAERDVLVVDPYFRFDQLFPLVELAEIRRVLASDRLSREDCSALRAGVEGIGLERALEVRLAPADLLHDRYFIAADTVLSLGTSINGVGSRMTIVDEVHDLEGAVRSNYEAVWRDATLLAQWSPDDAKTEASDQDAGGASVTSPPGVAGEEGSTSR